MTYVVSEDKNRSSYRIRFSPTEKGELDAQIERLGGPQFVIERLVRWFVAQDEIAQGMILGTIKPRDELVEMVVRGMIPAPSSRKLAADKKKK